MRTVTRTPGWLLLGLALFLGLGFVATVVRAADDDGKLKEKALSLNRVTGDEPEIEKMRELVQDPEGTRKLLKVASEMAKEKKQPFNATATLIFGRVADFLHQNDIAEQFFKLNVDQVAKIGGRKTVDGYAGLITVLFNNKKYAEAEKACRAFLELDADDKMKEFTPTVERQMVLAVVKQKQGERALKMVDDRINDNKDNWKLLQFKAQVQHLLEQNEAALKTYEEVIERIKKDDRLKKAEQEESIDTAERQMILVFVGLKQGDRAIKIIDDRIKDNKDNKNTWKLVRLKAQVQHMLDENEAALKTYQDVIDRINKDERLTKGEQEALVDQVQYSMTGVYVDMDEIKKATDILEKLLENDPDNPSYLNDLGFIWADHDQKLAESEKLIRKALEEDKKKRKADPDLAPEDDKDNGAYLDSLGWVLFKQKKYKEAKPYLVDAAKDEDAQHVEIFDHLGDVEMALGEKDAAVAAWKKGIEVAGPTKREQERKVAVEKKLKDAQK